MKHSLSAVVPLLLFLPLPSCYAQAGDTEPQGLETKQMTSEAGLKQGPLTILSAGKEHEFTVEIAQTEEEQARGLMFRTELAPNKGMIFPFAKDRTASFWMKNTVIPLDIIFVRRDGSIESIAANTTPYSLDPVKAGGPVAMVLELAGGRAAELSIVPDDQVSWKQGAGR